MSENRGYKLEFKLFLEGTEIPMKSATIASTPGGTMASINIYSNSFAHDILPKTSVQVFFKGWVPENDDYGLWMMCFDGYVSNVINQENAVEGRMLSLEARDIVTDLNKMPAAIVWTPDEELNGKDGYQEVGLFTTGKTRVFSSPGGGLENQGLLDLAEVVKWIAASGVKGGTQTTTKTGPNGIAEPTKSEGGLDVDTKKEKVKGKFRKIRIPVTAEGYTEAGLFLDAFARGIWSEAVDGGVIAKFLIRD